jgi:hypothetical protein
VAPARSPLLVLAALFGLAVSACGGAGGADGGGSRRSAAEVRAVVQRFYAAVGDQRGDRACALLTAELQRAYDRPPDACRKEVLRVVGTEPARGLQVQDVRVEGAKATAVAATRRGHGGAERIHTQGINLARTPAGWRIARFR